MTHEFRNIIKKAYENQLNGIQNILVTVVDLNGSSYRKPGVRMLLSSDGKMLGAVSGGCVEKEIQRRATSVFKNNISKVITYDGRFRLGCEGTLYILLEPLFISDDFLAKFNKNIKERTTFTINSFYKKEDDCVGNFGSLVEFKDHEISLSKTKIDEKNDVFSQTLKPIFRLLIIGGEHDVVKLSSQASQLGWQVNIVTSIKENKKLLDFPGANLIIAQTPELFEFTNSSENTAVVIMNHNFSYDLRWLIKLQEFNPLYIGILGAAKRRESLFNEFFEFSPDVSDDFLDTIYTPAGLHIGAETPEEIALSILAEILSVVRNKEVFSMKKITGKIHN